MRDLIPEYLTNKMSKSECTNWERWPTLMRARYNMDQRNKMHR